MPKPNNKSPAERLRSLQDLRAKGSITEAEFALLERLERVDWIAGLEDVQKELHRWKSAIAQVRCYTVSHSELLIRVYYEDQNGGPSPTSLYLYLKGCERVSFHSLWRDVDIRLEQRAGEYGPEVVVTDSDRLFVICSVSFAGESSEFLSLTGF